MKKKPNIIYIQNDHQAYYNWRDLGALAPRRPHFDQLAADGAVFENAYCATPLCGPTRRTVLTGLFAHTHGQHHNYTDPAYNHEVYLNNLHEAGYKNYYFGKWHAGPGDAKNHHTAGFCNTSYGNPYITKEYEDYLERYNLPKAAHRIVKKYTVADYDRQNMFPGLEEGALYSCKDNWCGEHAIGVTETPKETHEAFFLANLACEQLERIAQSDSDEPFSLRVDFWGPHQPHFPTQEFVDMYKDMNFPVYGSFESTLAGKPEWYRREVTKPFGDQDEQITIPCAVAWEEWQEIVRFCFAHITMIDAAGGMILNKLKELGLDEDTLIIWTTDHGDALASHGGHFDKGSYLCEEVMRIPLAMSWKGKIAPRQVRKEPICSIDYAVTMLDAAGTAFNNPVHGSSILPLVCTEEGAANWREDVMCETYGHGYGHELLSRMLVWKQYKYIATLDRMHELYDLEKDPFELENLIDDAAYATTLQEMRSRLVAWQEKTNDPVNFQF